MFELLSFIAGLVAIDIGWDYVDEEDTIQVCGGCGTIGCYDTPACWNFWHIEHHPTHDVSGAVCATCDDSY